LNGDPQSLEFADEAAHTGIDPETDLAWLDLAAFDEDGESLPIWPCRHCSRWHAEVVKTDDGLIVREWHAAECPHLRALVNEE